VRLAAWLSARGCRDANLRVLAIATSATAPFTISFALAPSGGMALGLFAASQFLYYLGQAPNNAALQIIVPNEMRGQVRALYQFIFNVVGYGLGPLIIALIHRQTVPWRSISALLDRADGDLPDAVRDHRRMAGAAPICRCAATFAGVELSCRPRIIINVWPIGVCFNRIATNGFRLYHISFGTL
jgi:MFS family permease